MFKPNAQINHNNTHYDVVLDHIITINDGMNNRVNDESHFVSSKAPITPNLEIGFINDYRAVEQTNPIGFWQTILANHTFDYSENFHHKFSIESEVYLISFDFEKGIVLPIDGSLVDVDSFDDIVINFEGFTHFEIIKTEQQKQQDTRHLYQTLVLKHLVFYTLLVGFVFVYYQSQKTDFVVMSQQLLSIGADSLDLAASIDKISSNTITTDTHIQQAHIKHLRHVLASGINIQKSNIDLTKPFARIVIDLRDLDMLKHIAKANNTAISTNKDFVKDTAEVSWRLGSDQ